MFDLIHCRQGARQLFFKVACTAVLLIASSCMSRYSCIAAGPAFLAGASAKNIDPRTLPVWVNGNMTSAQADRIVDSLFARSLVLSDGRRTVAICIVDNCILPLELVDKAKLLIQESTGLDPSSVLIAATHTHSAVAVAGVHGTPIQEDYASDLPGWIAESVKQAKDQLALAKWGCTSVDCDEYIYCRDWMMKPGTANSTHFSGRESNVVSMNPGNNNPNKIAPVGSIDRTIPILSIQDLEGNPISILASFSTHYAGAPSISSDYFGVTCELLSKKLRPESPDSFVGLMGNATSGNANCIDFSKPNRSVAYKEVGAYVANKILSALDTITYRTEGLVDCALESIELQVRMPHPEEVSAAKKYIESRMVDRLPQNTEENYARETVLLSELPPTRKLNLQAIRLGDFAIIANPCESYNETGLKLRQASPFATTMNIGLANGHAGYIPPPEMFQLGGYTTWRCRTSCLEEQAEPKMVDGLVRVTRQLYDRKTKTAKALETESAPLNQGNPNSPLNPKESLKWFEMEPGFEIQLVASEPQVVDPVSIQIDARGRMWVVEMRDYPSEDSKPKSRIVLLEDVDRDGFFEKSQVFADGLLYATGVQPWQDGAIVTAHGQLLMLRDTDGDGRSDKQEVWLDGFSTGNPQLRANHPILTADGWLTIASGLRGGKLTSSLPFAKEQVNALDIAGADVRISMIDGQVETISGPTQFGQSFDWQGHRYGCSNRQPCFEVLAEANDLALSPLAGLASPLHFVSAGEGASRVHPLVRAWTTSNLHAGQFTAACGMLVTHSQHFPDAPYATVLTCEPTGGLVQRKAIERKAGRSSTVSDSSQDSAQVQEWLASRDPWFRPVDLLEGPIGDIYVVDMYRAVIEHPEWVPSELKNRPDQRFGDSLGRIYRVVRSSHSGQTPPRLGAVETDVIGWLKSPHSWNRSIAARRVLESNSTNSISAELVRSLKEIATDQKQSNAVVATVLDLLGAVGRLDEETVESTLSSADSDRRYLGWRVLRQAKLTDSARWNAIAEKSLSSASTSEDELRGIAWFVASQPVESVERNETLLQAAANALQSRADDPQSWIALSAACRSNLQFLLANVSDTSPLSAIAIARLANKLAGTLSSTQVHDMVEEISKGAISNKDTESASLHASLAKLEGLMSSGKADLGLSSTTEEVLMQVLRSDANIPTRLRAVSMLAFLKTDETIRQSLALLQSNDLQLQRAAIKTCSVHDAPEFTDWLIEQFPTSLPETRQEIFTAIRSKPRRLSRLLEQLESGKISIRTLDASQMQSLQTIREKSLLPRIERILASSIQTNRQKVIDEYSQRLQNGDKAEMRALGTRVFEKNCATCHRMNSMGVAVGPDISDSREPTYEKLLISILDPNRSIDANYIRYLARMEDGRVLEGLLTDANSQTFKLTNQTGSIVVDRPEVEELKSSGTSLMPEGLESQISPVEMNALLWYIKNWRYAQENVPAQAAATRK